MKSSLQHREEMHDKLESLESQRKFIRAQMEIDHIWTKEIMKEWEQKDEAISQEISQLINEMKLNK